MSVLSKFRNLIAYLVYDKDCLWLEFIISILADIEMQKELIFNADLKSKTFDAWYAKKEIPKNTIYCENCIFMATSRIANFFYGEQSSGYCYYLGKGDYSFISPTLLLWDGCKECGINEDLEEE